MFDEPWHTVVLPVMLPGCAGVVVTVTLRFDAEEVPHALVAVTEMVPPVAPAVVLMLFVVLLPVHPPGSVQV